MYIQYLRRLTWVEPLAQIGHYCCCCCCNCCQPLPARYCRLQLTWVEPLAQLGHYCCRYRCHCCYYCQQFRIPTPYLSLNAACSSFVLSPLCRLATATAATAASSCNVSPLTCVRMLPAAPPGSAPPCAAWPLRPH
jgi:hypothetical protein